MTTNKCSCGSDKEHEIRYRDILMVAQSVEDARPKSFVEASHVLARWVLGHEVEAFVPKMKGP